LLLLSFEEEAREAVLAGAVLEPVLLASVAAPAVEAALLPVAVLDPVAALEAALEEAEDDEVALPVVADPSKAGVLRRSSETNKA
jgi:hypothetical protein